VPDCVSAGQLLVMSDHIWATLVPPTLPAGAARKLVKVALKVLPSASSCHSMREASRDQDQSRCGSVTT
jgi:hypothetical protein